MGKSVSIIHPTVCFIYFIVISFLFTSENRLQTSFGYVLRRDEQDVGMRMLEMEPPGRRRRETGKREREKGEEERRKGNIGELG